MRNAEWVECPDVPHSYAPLFGRKFNKIYYCGVCSIDGSVLIPIKYTHIKYLRNREYQCELDGISAIIKV